MYGKSPLTVSSIVVKKEVIMEVYIARGVNVLSKEWQTIEEVKQLMLIWIKFYF